MAETRKPGRGLLVELIGEVFGAIFTMEVVKKMLQDRIKNSTEQPVASEQDEAIWGAILTRCGDRDRKEAQDDAGGNPPDPQAAPKPMPLHTYASLLVEKMQRGQRAIFLKVMQSLYALKYSKPGAAPNTAPQNLSGDIDQCLDFIADLRSNYPSPDKAVAHLEKQQLAAKTFVDRVSSNKLVKEVYALIKDLSWEDAKRALRNWPDDVDTLEKFCLAMEGWTKRTRRETAAKKARRLSDAATLAATPLLKRRSTWWITLSVALALVGSCLLAIKIDLQRWSAVSNPQRFGTEVPSYLERSEAGTAAVAAQQQSIWAIPELWLLILGLLLALASIVMLKLIKPATVPAEAEPFATTPQMRTVETELVTEEDTGLWLDAQRRRRRITREISRQEVPVDEEESTEEGDGDGRR